MRNCFTLALACACTGALLLGRPAAADDKDKWGTVKGQVVWPGDKLPEARELKVDKDQDHCLSRGKIVSEEWVVNKDNKGIRWVFVWLAPLDDKDALPVHPDQKNIKDKEVVLDQPCCKFEPHSLALREGQVLVAKNTSPVNHNLKYGGHPVKNPGGNPLIPAKESVKIDNLKADRIPVKVECSLHPWMQGYIRVFDHPYFALTDADGKFEIKDAPAGEYKLMIWHDSGWLGGKAGRNGQKITIKGGQVNDLGQLKWKSDE